jgi:hypothetical protein
VIALIIGAPTEAASASARPRSRRPPWSRDPLATIAIARSTRTALPIGAERGHRGAVTPADVEHQQVPAGTAAGRALLLVFDGHLVAYCERRASRGHEGADAVV